MPWTRVPLSAAPEAGRAHEGARSLGYVDAVREALELALELDHRVLVLGQGVEDSAGAMFGTTRGLIGRFGAERVFDTPVSEDAMTGVCVGAAMNGLRPVLMHNRPDFVLLSMNQLVSHAAKLSYMDNGQTRVPMVVWAAIGRGWGSGPQHTQAVHGMLMGVPGLKILMPSTPYDAKGLMLSAIADENPVLVFDHRWVMRQAPGPVPEGNYRVPIGKGVYRRRGGDLTIVGVSHTLTCATEAIDRLSPRITADVIDLRSVRPLDHEIILESVRRTGRLLVADTAWTTGGLSAEVGCLVAERAHSALKAPLRRVGFADCPSPAGFALERHFYPDAERIAAVIEEMLA
ncbi:MAG TPA: transketolase C-terminal domain-containing protein [Bdellovibrionota bacterium]|nr:transketolase C-terminal domain-containing protein [Bdellovibrionota bacterium]